ncbi:MAG: hypothetical protein HZC55_18200 [Verrucomicrobia bacterium]|nr:hypothetical protein [Verrucomicrobiota bacterium]
MRKLIGWAMILLSAGIILVNVLQSRENARIREEHPIVTFLSGGSNLKPAHTFLPPYSGFEVGIIVMGVIGLILVLLKTSEAE